MYTCTKYKYFTAATIDVGYCYYNFYGDYDSRPRVCIVCLYKLSHECYERYKENDCSHWQDSEQDSDVLADGSEKSDYLHRWYDTSEWLLHSAKEEEKKVFENCTAVKLQCPFKNNYI